MTISSDIPRIWAKASLRLTMLEFRPDSEIQPSNIAPGWLYETAPKFLDFSAGLKCLNVWTSPENLIFALLTGAPGCL